MAAARSQRTLAELVRSIGNTGGHAIHVVADVGDRKQVQAIAEEAVRHFGRIDTWVNNAGISIYGRLEEVTDADNRRLFETNFWGVVYGSLAALPYLETSGGALINVGSEVSDDVIALLGMYSASKHAVKAFTDTLHRAHGSGLAGVGDADPAHGRGHTISGTRAQLHGPRAEASDASHRADPGGAGDPGCRGRTEARRQGRADGEDQHRDLQACTSARGLDGRETERPAAIRRGANRARGCALPAERDRTRTTRTSACCARRVKRRGMCYAPPEIASAR